MGKTKVTRERSISSGSIGCKKSYRILLKEEVKENGEVELRMLVSVNDPYEVPVRLDHFVELLLDAGFIIKWPVKLDKKSNRRVFK